MDKNYTIAESYELPSKGLIYEGNVKTELRLRSMTTMEEMRRQSPSNRPLKTLAEIIDDCLIDKLGISAYDMCIGDYEYLLHKLRLVTYGPQYDMLVECQNCGNVEEVKYDLNDEVTLPFDLDKFNELLTLHLPKSDKDITLTYQTPRILDDIELKAAEFNRKNKDAGYDPRKLFAFQFAIQTVDGAKMRPFDLETFIKQLPAADSNLIEARIGKINKQIGLDNTFMYGCSRCGFDNTTFFRFGRKFFRPEIDE